MKLEQIFNAPKNFDVFEMPCCPLCDNAIEEAHPIALMRCRGSLCLVHAFCAEEALTTCD